LPARVRPAALDLYKYWYILILDEAGRLDGFEPGGLAGDATACPSERRAALYTAQQGEIDPAAKPLKGFGGARVMEIVERYRTDAYRAIYTVQFADTIYVLHVFMKKSTRGIATPKPDIDLIRRRLAEAERRHRERRN
jgi:phage-related protein